MSRSSGKLQRCSKAGADPEAIPAWIGTERARMPRVCPREPSDDHPVSSAIRPDEPGRSRIRNPEHGFVKSLGQAYNPRLRAMISFWISVVPPKIDWTWLSRESPQSWRRAVD
jgi:hypothetical protein